MPSPTETVTAFLKLWEKPGGMRESIRAYFTPATVWENVGLAVTTGPDQAMGFIAAFETQLAMSSARVDLLALAEVGDKVLTERIDHMLGAGGEPVMSIPVMGIFEVRDGKIAAWRDYFDTLAFSTPKPGA
jgi:limonene-1,2-epoxide hydrolase